MTDADGAEEGDRQFQTSPPPPARPPDRHSNRASLLLFSGGRAVFATSIFLPPRCKTTEGGGLGSFSGRPSVRPSVGWSCSHEKDSDVFRRPSVRRANEVLPLLLPQLLTQSAQKDTSAVPRWSTKYGVGGEGGVKTRGRGREREGERQRQD